MSSQVRVIIRQRYLETVHDYFCNIRPFLWPFSGTITVLVCTFSTGRRGVYHCVLWRVKEFRRRECFIFGVWRSYPHSIGEWCVVRRPPSIFVLADRDFLLIFCRESWGFLVVTRWRRPLPRLVYERRVSSLVLLQNLGLRRKYFPFLDGDRHPSFDLTTDRF